MFLNFIKIYLAEIVIASAGIHLQSCLYQGPSYILMMRMMQVFTSRRNFSSRAKTHCVPHAFSYFDPTAIAEQIKVDPFLLRNAIGREDVVLS